MKFLILTQPDDTHAVLVKLALEKLDHQVQLLFTADQPSRQKNSIFLDGTNYRWKAVNDTQLILENDYEVVWWRRPHKPYLARASSHPEDYKFILKENILFHEALTSNLAPDAWWVNSKEAANRANSKLLQLKMAASSGMIIPLTLCSNNPQDIRSFVRKHEHDGVIYKPLNPGCWYENNQLKMLYTSAITSLALPSDQLLQLNPGIYQKEIKKKYELRVTCFGDYLVAAKLHSQPHKQGRVDWRVIPQGEMVVEPYTLPFGLKKQIQNFMHALGLVFGCLDFIVTTEGEYLFLEVNEQGQFLWIEEYNQSFKMLDIFVNFLLQRSSHFIWKEDSLHHSINFYRSRMSKIVAANLKKHVDLNKALH